MNRKTSLLSGKVEYVLFRHSINMFFGLLSAVAFNLIDTFFISKLGTDELAAISFTFPVVLFIGSIANGIGVATSAVASKAIGEKNHYKLKRLTSDSLVLSLIIVSFFIIIGICTIEPLFKLMGADNNLISLIEEYMLYWYPGMIFLIIPMVGNNAIRATGDTKKPSLIMIFSVGINLILDPVFIFGFGPVPAMGIKGAAIATILARAVTLILSLYFIIFKYKMITTKRPNLKELKESWSSILYIGLPAAASNIIVPLAGSFITFLMSKSGKEAVAAYGVASRIETLFMIIMMSLSSVLNPFIGQNLGSNKNERILLGIKRGIQFGFIWGLTSYLILLTCAEDIAFIFNGERKVVEIVVLYFMIIPVSFGFTSLIRIIQVALNVFNEPLASTRIMFIQMILLHIPLSYSGYIFAGIEGLFSGIVSASILSSLYALNQFNKLVKTKLL